MSGGRDLLMMPGGIPFASEAPRAGAYLKATNGRSKTYAATYEGLAAMIEAEAADLTGLGHPLAGAEIDHITAGPRYSRDKGIWGTRVILRHDGEEWRITKATKRRVYGFQPPITKTTPASRIH